MKINKMCAVIKPKYNVKTLPEHLFYHHTKSTKQQPWDIFIMFSTKGKKDRGLLVCRKTTTQFRDDYEGKTLCVDNILAIPQYMGLGSKILEFAKNYSKKSGCNGYMILKADSSFTPDKIPHLFYRKKNFTTLNKKNDKKWMNS